MEYQRWLKEYGIELGKMHPEVRLADVDSKFLQSLYLRGLEPEAAGQMGVVRRDEESDSNLGISGFLDRFKWEYAVAAAGVLLLGALLVGRQVRVQRAPRGPTAIHAPASGNVPYRAGYYASGEVSIPATPSLGQDRSLSGATGRAYSPAPLPSGFALEMAYPPIFRSLGTGYPPPARLPATAPGHLSLADGPAGASSRTSSGQAMSATSAAAPVIEQFEITTSDANEQGLTGTVTWKVMNADSVQLLLFGVPVAGATDPSGSVPFESLAPGSVFTLRAFGGGHVVEQSETAEGTGG